MVVLMQKERTTTPELIHNSHPVLEKNVKSRQAGASDYENESKSKDTTH